MNTEDKSKIKKISEIKEFCKLDQKDQIQVLSFTSDITDKYALREMHLESLLAYYCMVSDSKDWQDDEKCSLCFDIAEAYSNLGYAVLAQTICACAFSLIKEGDQKGALETRYYYLSTKFFNMIEDAINANKNLKKALKSYETNSLSFPLLLANIYSESARVSYEHPLQSKKQALKSFLKAIDIKKVLTPLPISIVCDQLQYLNAQDGLSPDMRNFLDDSLRDLANIAYSKHYYSCSLYSKLARNSEDEATKLDYYSKAIEAMLLDYLNNKNVSSLTWLCNKIGLYLYSLQKYEDALEFFLISEKLYDCWEERDTCDFKALYEYICAIYSKLEQKDKVNEYKQKYSKQNKISVTILMASQFQYLSIASLFEFIECRATTILHKDGYSKKNIDDYIQLLLKRLQEKFEQFETEEKRNRTFSDCMGEIYFELGRIFWRGDYGLDSDKKLAHFLFEKGVAHNSIQSVFAMKSLFSEDSLAEFELKNVLQSAFEKGDRETGYTIAMMHPYGSKEREYYLKEAASGSSEIAQYQLGLIYRDRVTPEDGEPFTDEMIADMTSAVDLWRKSANNGYLPAETELGLVYNSDRIHYDLGIEPYNFSIVKNVTHDKNEALKHFLVAAKSGDSRAQFMLGQFYMIDKDYKDYSQAEFWFTLAVKQKVAMAYLYMARIYTDKNDLAFFNYNDALFWYDKAVKEFSKSNDPSERSVAMQAEKESEHFRQHNFFLQPHSKELSWDENIDGV